MIKEKFNPIESSNNIKKNYTSFITSTFDLSNSDLYSEKFNLELEKRSLYKGPFLDIVNVFKKGKSLGEIITEGKLSKEFYKLKDLHIDDRTLYKHQEIAIRKSLQGENIIVSTGTGSGKTESFLIPILDYLMKQKENNQLGPGVRAMLLYPMNALANDQLERVREILSGYPEITFGRYTGETEEKEKWAKKTYYELNGKKPLVNELISREVMRSTPPNILFTNYSMLEFLMIRPNDKNLFIGDYADEWKFIVLDEAHVYNGASGIEVSLLLRRLKSYIGESIQYVLTSATLGRGSEDFPAIIEFASRLCDAKFNEKSIISAIRQDNLKISDFKRFNLNYYLELSKLKIDESSKETVQNITKKYGYHNKSYERYDVKSYLYNILKNDQNLYDVIEVSKEQIEIKEICSVLKSYNRWDEHKLVEFVNVASKCVYNNQALFDSRYHMFIRSLEGAFVSLNPTPQIKLSRHKYIGDLKAYEIGVCRYCKSIYIVGVIDYSTNVLIQNEEVDLHESFNEWEERQIDYFLLEKQENNDLEDTILTEYSLCSLCGHIRKSSELNIGNCECGEQYRNLVYREEPKKIQSKLHKCIACGSKSNGNIIRQFFLGKDSATSLLSQFLFNELANTTIEYSTKKIEPDEFGVFSESKTVTNKLVTNKVKQFIAFSDSRQQAAFFASHFDSEHNKNIRKRIIIDILNKQSKSNIKLVDFVHELEAKIKQEKLFIHDTNSSTISEAWISLLYELLDVDRRYSLEGLGMISFEYNLTEIESVPTSHYFLNVTLNEYKSLLINLLDTLRSIPAINYKKYKVLSSNYQDLLDYRRFDNSITLQKEKGNKNTTGWLSKTTPNSRTNYIQKAMGVPFDTANSFLKVLWNQFIEKKIIVTNNNNEYRLDFSRFTLAKGNELKWYKCSKCNKVTRWNYKNVCSTYKCDGVLESVMYEEMYADNFYKNQFETMPIENISIREHTAQLDRKKATKYQRDFINEKLNILSCSTTFEMGVDVGKLETVFLRNMPPSPANYAQRAGRAGRRIESAAYVLTYCGLSSHDFSYFEEPRRMIEGKIKPPYFVVANEKIIKRHVYAVALGEFFMCFPEFYDRVETFFDMDGVSKFRDFLVSKPERVDLIIRRFVPESIYTKSYSDFSWIDELILKEDCYFNIITNEFTEEIKNIQNALETAKETNMFVAYNLEKLIKTKKKERIVSFLSRKNVIPKYGFPVDNVDLVTQFDKGNKLNRDLSIAISEYAPGSEIVVDKYKITSRYIKKIEGFALEEQDYFKCDVCNKLNTRIHGDDGKEVCDVCGNIQEYKEKFLIPKFGFIASNEEVKATTQKPKKSYSGDIFYVGKGQPISYLEFHLNDIIIKMQSTGNDELVVINENPFFTCDICGYSKIDVPKMHYPYQEFGHENHKGYTCSNTRLNRHSLGHSYKTDVVRITFDISIDYEKGLSVLYGLLEAISSYLDIERRDISGVIVKNPQESSIDYILFDTVPGGAGHVKRLMNERLFTNILYETKRIMTRNCCDVETSCYTCLRNYYNQKIHHRLKRINVLNFLESFKLK